MMLLPMVSVLGSSGAVGSLNSWRLSLPIRLAAPAMTPRVPWPVASTKSFPEMVHSVSVELWWQITERSCPSSITTSSTLVFR